MFMNQYLRAPRGPLPAFLSLALLTLAAVPAASLPQDATNGASTATTVAEGQTEPEVESEVESDGEQGLRPSQPIRSEILVTASAPELVSADSFSGDQVRQRVNLDLADFFQSFAGGEAVRRGSVNLDPNIRGLAESQVAMFVDDTRTFAAGPGRMDSEISHVPTGSVQRMEVVKGPYALTWGAGTLSALRLTTWRPDFRPGGFAWQGRLAGAYGDNGSRQDGAAGVWGSSETLRFFVDLGHRQGDDYEAGDGSTVPGDFRSTEGRWRLGWKPSEPWTVDYSGGYQEQMDLDFPGRLLDASYFYSRSHAVDVVWQGSDRLFEAKVYSNSKDHLMNNDEKPTAQDMPGRIPPFGIDVGLGTLSDTRGGRVAWQTQLETLEVHLGSDYYHLRQDAQRTISRRSNGVVLFRDIVWPDATVDNLGAYGQVIYRGPRYSLSATLRGDQVDIEAEELSDFFLANVPGAQSHAESDESHLSAAVSSRFVLDPHWTLSAGIGRAVRSANILERFSDRFPSTRFQISAEILGNPLLEPEESLQLDLGLQGVYGDFLVSLNLFQRTIDNVITFVADPTVPRRLPLSPPQVYRYVNGRRADYLGAELNLRQRIDSRWSWTGVVAWMEADDVELDEPMVGIPPTHGQAALRWTSDDGRLWIDGAVNFADRQDRVAVQRFEQPTPGWVTYDLAMEWQATSRLSAGVTVANLTDHAYARHLDAPNPFTGQRILQAGRDVKVRLQLRF